MPQGHRVLFLLTILWCFASIDVYGQCGTLAITGVSTTPVSCNGGSNGTITVQTTGGTGPFTYANGTSTAIGGAAAFGSSSTLSTTSSGSTSVWWSPGSCTDGSWVYNSSSGCPAGSARFSRNTAFAGCFLRSPQTNMNGVNLVSITFDVSHSYDSQRPNDRARFYCWVNNGYPSAPTTVNGVSGNYLYFNQSRTCQSVTVTLDLSSVPTNSRSDFLFYIETDCQYNNCSSYFMEVDNIQFAQGSSFQTSNTFTGLTAGNYPITVQDANGCTLTYASNPVVVTQPNALSVSTSLTSPTTVGGSNGKAWATVTGGTAPYTYVWSAGTPGATADTIKNLTAANYTVTVTDNKGCTATGSVAVTNPTCALAITSVGKVNATCAGLANGSFTIVTSGANGAVEYSINGGANWQSSNSFANLASGNYTVQVRDAAGCNSSAVGNPQVITAPQIMSLNFGFTPASTIGGSNGAINLTVTGGTTPRTFQWSNGQSTEDISNLAAGNYCVTATDNSGCTITGCGNVTQPTCNLAVTSVVVGNPSCNGGSNGSIAITTSGANGAVEYSVNGGSTWSSTSPIGGLSSGSYTVQVRDAAGCTANAPLGSYTLTQPTAISLGFSVAPVSIVGGTDGSVNLTVINGTAPLTYQWSNGAVTEDISALAVGQYCVTVTAGNGCTATGCDNVGQAGCSLAISNVSVSNAQCNGGADGSLIVSVTGGAGLVEYSRNGGSTWSASNSFTGLAAGNYTVQIRDGNGCTATGGPYTVSQPTALSLNTVVVNVSQFGGNDGSINLTASGGATPYTYVWNTNAVAEDLTGLSAGIYCVTVTDDNGCTETICENVTQPASGCSGFGVTNVAVVQPNCPGDNGTITVSITGGQNPILYSIDSGATFQNGVSLFTVGGGTYKVLVRDNNGCEAVYSSNPITINTLQAINPTITQVGDTLFVSDLGTSYQWLYGGNPIANADDTSYTVIANGSYTVVVTDANGCTYTSAAFQVTGVGVSEVSNLQCQLWPNPTENMISFNISATNANIEVYSTDGRLVLTQTITQPSGQLDLSGLSHGVYNIRVVSAEGQAIKRVIKY